MNKLATYYPAGKLENKQVLGHVSTPMYRVFHSIKNRDKVTRKKGFIDTIKKGAWKLGK